MPDILACVFVSDGCSSSQFVKSGLKYFILFFVNEQTFIFWPGKVQKILHDQVACFKIPGQIPQPI